jgi:hypothetical protein
MNVPYSKTGVKLSPGEENKDDALFAVVVDDARTADVTF